MFQEYTKLIENLLENFLSENKISAEEVYLCCQRIEGYDENLLLCLDYILASTDYEEFYCLMMQYKVIFI